jgi:itaconate CoA-transferase
MRKCEVIFARALSHVEGADSCTAYLYARKKTTPEQAVADIADSSTMVHGMASGEPPALLGAIAARLRAGDLRDVKIYTLLPGRYALESYLAVDLADCVIPCMWFVSPADRNMVRVGLNHFVPNLFHQIPRFINELMKIDVALTTVSPMDKNGFFTFGTSLIRSKHLPETTRTMGRFTNNLIVSPMSDGKT